MARRDGTFTTLTTEGGLLPADLLARIAQNDTALRGLKPADYHLNANERLGEMINRSWNRAIGAWTAFQESLAKLGPDDNGTTVTRERWLLVLFEELGFGRLQPSRAIDVGGRQFPISHEWGGYVALHLVGARVDLDHRTAGVVGAARSSPHSLVQELLNASADHLWGVVSNGRELRLLRDNAALTRQAFVSFDLDGMMSGQVYPDFVLLWLLLHESRFERLGSDPSWLEQWAREAEAQGSRALDQLRAGVETAIAAFGRGFLVHAGNKALREAVRSGSLDRQDYYRELLRLVYRLLFLFVAEDRGLLVDPDGEATARERYFSYYSVDRLRRLAERRRGTQHSDLYDSLKVVMAALDTEGAKSLCLQALGSFLWSPSAIPHLSDAALSNRDLLAGIHALTSHASDDGKARRTTDYRNLGAEELGSVYESLLELHPEMNADSGIFELKSVAGHERKSTGSYYTPTSLINSLLDSALDPVLEDAASRPQPEAAVLALRIVDPACGSGHFLISASHRIAKRLATLRTGDDEPSPQATRSALREVIGRCIYGVDKNEMAVELCKVSLWMEAMEPGKPLSFLDHHVVCGDSLVGASPELIAGGVPDAAFKPIEGDDKAIAASLRRRNAQETGGQDWLPLDQASPDRTAQIGMAVAALESLSDDDVASVREKERRFQQLKLSETARRLKLSADAWCSAFIVPKGAGLPAITQSTVREAENESGGLAADVIAVITQTAAEFNFHHWHVAFPEVFSPAGADVRSRVGFDVVLGNPPWDRVKLQELEWFAGRRPDIAAAPGAKRKKLIAGLSDEDPGLLEEFRGAVRKSEAISHFLRDSGRFPLCGRGDVNTYSVFAETMQTVLNPRGCAGIIVPAGVATDDTTKEFFASLVNEKNLVSLFGFENEALVFPAVHHAFRFCLLTISGSKRPATGGADFCFFARSVADIEDRERRFKLSAEDIALLNPNSMTCPTFRSKQEAEVCKGVYRRVPVLIRDAVGAGAANTWDISFLSMFHMTNDSALFRTRLELEAAGGRLVANVFSVDGVRYLPLYEGKLFHVYNHRWATYDGLEVREPTDEERADPTFVVQPRYWVAEPDVERRLPSPRPKWLLAWRDITGTVNERTTVVSALPLCAANNKAPLVMAADPRKAVLLGACLSSFAVDFVSRVKVGGNNLTIFVLKQLPVLAAEQFDAPAPWDHGVTIGAWVTSRALELTFTASDMVEYANTVDCFGPPFRWDMGRRAILKADLDAAMFIMYGFSRAEVEFVMDGFAVVQRKDEKAYGEYRTKQLILNAFDSLTDASANGQPYQSPVSVLRAEPVPFS